MPGRADAGVHLVSAERRDRRRGDQHADGAEHERPACGSSQEGIEDPFACILDVGVLEAAQRRALDQPGADPEQQPAGCDPDPQPGGGAAAVVCEGESEGEQRQSDGRQHDREQARPLGHTYEQGHGLRLGDRHEGPAQIGRHALGGRDAAHLENARHEAADVGEVEHVARASAVEQRSVDVLCGPVDDRRRHIAREDDRQQLVERRLGCDQVFVGRDHLRRDPRARVVRNALVLERLNGVRREAATVMDVLAQVQGDGAPEDAQEPEHERRGRQGSAETRREMHARGQYRAELRATCSRASPRSPPVRC